jgi:hypothetical protein
MSHQHRQQDQIEKMACGGGAEDRSLAESIAPPVGGVAGRRESRAKRRELKRGVRSGASLPSPTTKQNDEKLSSPQPGDPLEAIRDTSVLERYQGFGSAFLPQRVHCEPDTLAPCDRRAGTLFSDQLNDQLFVG